MTPLSLQHTILLLGVLLGACAPQDSDNGARSRTFDIDFDSSLQGWIGGFTDYPPGNEVAWMLESGHRNLPAPLDTNRRGFYISGNNHSDDLFMYLRGRLDGLRPDTRYGLEFTVEVATNAPSGCVGVGGAPGESVTLKTGATTIEPTPARINQEVDKGNQGTGGRDAMAIGHIGNLNTDCSNPVYQLKSLTSRGQPFSALTAADGTLWALIGTDSGFEATTSLYYTRITIQAQAE